jgi:PTH1 family peptidyl-tRNA hydrolase
MKFLIAGLGNIGDEYHFTRHNIGFMAIDELALKNNLYFTLGKYAYYTELRVKGKIIVLIKPTTYMNLSGTAIQHWMHHLNIQIENILVITDDIAIPFGEVRLKKSGSCGGHNGLKSIEIMLQSQHYPRLRIGIGNNFPKGKQADYVLSKFNDEELKSLPFLLQNVSEIIVDYCFKGIETTMNKYNKKLLI